MQMTMGILETIQEDTDLRMSKFDSNDDSMTNYPQPFSLRNLWYFGRTFIF
jgi:hypothetical protein